MIDIEALIRSKDQFRVEVKKVSGGIPDSLWESYSALANTNGGVILLGVSEVGKNLVITGVSEVQEKMKMLWNSLNNRQKVSLNILFEHQIYVHTRDGKDVIVMEVPRADRRDKPIFINNDLQRGAYRRNAAGDYHCSLLEIKAMLRDQSDVPSDSRVIEEVSLNDLTKETLVVYRKHFASLKPAHAWSRLDNENFLHKIGAAGRSASGTLKATLAGLLMFGTKDIITRILPDYCLDYREINDSMRWDDRVVSNLGEWSGNVFDFFFKITDKLTAGMKAPFCMRNYRERKNDSAVQKAIREALINALIHADYYGRQGIVIEKRPQKIVFANPGIFRPNKDEVFDGGISDPRNPNIYKMFALINMTGQAGSGLLNIRTIWQEAGWPDPVWEEKFTLDRLILSVPVGMEGKGTENKDDNFKAVAKVPLNKELANAVPEIFPECKEKDNDLFLKFPENQELVKKVPEKTPEKTPEKVTKNQELILSNIIRDPHITIPILASIVGISERKIKENISKLKAKGLLERVGPDKGGYWKAI